MTTAVNIPPDLVDNLTRLATDQGTTIEHLATKYLRAGHDLLYGEGNSPLGVLLADNARLILACEQLQRAHAALAGRYETLALIAFQGTVVSVEE